MSAFAITPEMRVRTRERVIAFEKELRLDQSYAQPSQIIDREAVPLAIGGYTDEQIDKIIQIEAELKAKHPEETEDVLLSRALQRYNISA
jgi:hypothetical protein